MTRSVLLPLIAKPAAIHGEHHAAASDGNAATRGAGYSFAGGIRPETLKRLKVAGRHWRPIAQQAASPAFEIPLAVPAHIADPAMAANVAPHPFAGTAHAPGAADALVLHEDLPSPGHHLDVTPAKDDEFRHAPRREARPAGAPASRHERQCRSRRKRRSPRLRLGQGPCARSRMTGAWRWIDPSPRPLIVERAEVGSNGHNWVFPAAEARHRTGGLRGP